jgi:hypothetical protein
MKREGVKSIAVREGEGRAGGDVQRNWEGRRFKWHRLRMACVQQMGEGQGHTQIRELVVH